MHELEKLAEWIVGLDYDDLPESVTQAAVHRILDTVCDSAGAACEEALGRIRSVYLSALTGKGAGRASLFGTGNKTDVRTAAFLNALSGHYMELDDVHCESKTHIGTVVVPAAYAVAEAIGASGKDLICAVVSGYETAARIGMAYGVASHRKLGWHSTATAGIFGAAAACARLLRLDAEQCASALGMAGTQAFGRWAFLAEGATCKTLHPARAASGGLESVFLAAAGMTGPHEILTAEDGGLLRAMSTAWDESLVCSGLGQTWEILNVDDKPYPCCRSTHGAIDAALRLRRQHDIHAEQIQSVKIETYQVGKLQCATSEGSLSPKTPMEAKFSTPYTAACALLYGGVGLDDFLPCAVLRDEVQSLLKKVQVRETEAFTAAYPTHWGCRMTVSLTSGERYSHTVPDASGSKDQPLTRDQLTAKAERLLSRVQSLRSAELMQSLLSLRETKTVPVVADYWDGSEKET